MTNKHNALESVRLSAELYYSDQASVAASHKRLIEDINRARENGATQQQIADATKIDEEHKLSRQRIAQLLQGQ